MKIFQEPLEFAWDKGNSDKNQRSHGVSDKECEEVFLDPDKKLFSDILHSDQENRFILLGKTKLDRILFLVFTMRVNRIRIISARDINKKEVNLYYEKRT